MSRLFFCQQLYLENWGNAQKSVTVMDSGSTPIESFLEFSTETVEKYTGVVNMCVCVGDVIEWRNKEQFGRKARRDGVNFSVRRVPFGVYIHNRVRLYLFLYFNGRMYYALVSKTVVIN